MDVNQCQEYIEITCPGYIDCFLRLQDWKDTPFLSERPLSSLPTDTIHQMNEEVLGPSIGGSTEHTFEFSTESVPIEYTQQSVPVLLYNKCGYIYRSKT